MTTAEEGVEPLAVILERFKQRYAGKKYVRIDHLEEMITTMYILYEIAEGKKTCPSSEPVASVVGQ